MQRYNLTTPHGPDTTDPRGIDWPARQARAIVPFALDYQGLPVNPLRPDLPAGRNGLWHWGEACAADAIVLAINAAGSQHLLMIERVDGHGWATPGGMLDPGETPQHAAARELAEETGLTLPETHFDVKPGRYMPDPRAGRSAWMVGFPAVAYIPGPPPRVYGRDDARRAAWVPANDYAELTESVAGRGGRIFAAHREMLRKLLG